MTVAIQAYTYVVEYATLFVAQLWPKLGGYFSHITICESGGHLQFFFLIKPLYVTVCTREPLAYRLVGPIGCLLVYVHHKQLSDRFLTKSITNHNYIVIFSYNQLILAMQLIIQ